MTPDSDRQCRRQLDSDPVPADNDRGMCKGHRTADSDPVLADSDRGLCKGHRIADSDPVPADSDRESRTADSDKRLWVADNDRGSTTVADGDKGTQAADSDKGPLVADSDVGLTDSDKGPLVAYSDVRICFSLDARGLEFSCCATGKPGQFEILGQNLTESKGGTMFTCFLRHWRNVLSSFFFYLNL